MKVAQISSIFCFFPWIIHMIKVTDRLFHTWRFRGLTWEWVYIYKNFLWGSCDSVWCSLGFLVPACPHVFGLRPLSDLSISPLPLPAQSAGGLAPPGHPATLFVNITPRRHTVGVNGESSSSPNCYSLPLHHSNQVRILGKIGDVFLVLQPLWYCAELTLLHNHPWGFVTCKSIYCVK